MTTTTTTETHYGEALKSVRVGLRLTQRDLGHRITGRRTQAAQQLVSRLERGVRVQSEGEAERIATRVRAALGELAAGPLAGHPPVFRQAGSTIVATRRVRAPLFARASYTCARCGAVTAIKAKHGARVDLRACPVCGGAL